MPQKNITANITAVKLIGVFGYLFAVVFAAGFAAFPVWAFFTFGSQ